ncbi:MAG: hypothetical protein KR126chlam3_00290 [Chlamydiae bacterium]|nr:hypothetical protein [Chlamydiota bacterium]
MFSKEDFLIIVVIGEVAIERRLPDGNIRLATGYIVIAIRIPHRIVTVQIPHLLYEKASGFPGPRIPDPSMRGGKKI